MYTWKLLAQCYWLWFQHCKGSTIGKSLCVIAHLLGSCWSLKDHRLDIRLEMRIDSFEAGIYWQPIGFLVLSIQIRGTLHHLFGPQWLQRRQRQQCCNVHKRSRLQREGFERHKGKLLDHWGATGESDTTTTPWQNAHEGVYKWK